MSDDRVWRCPITGELYREHRGLIDRARGQGRSFDLQNIHTGNLHPVSQDDLDRMERIA